MLGLLETMVNWFYLSFIVSDFLPFHFASLGLLKLKHTYLAREKKTLSLADVFFIVQFLFADLKSCGNGGSDCFRTLGVLRVSLGCFVSFSWFLHAGFPLFS